MINRYSGLEMTPSEQADLTRFTWNPGCTTEDIEKMHVLRNGGKDLCELIIANVPNCADRSSAIRYLRLAIMQANLAIAQAGLSA